MRKPMSVEDKANIAAMPPEERAKLKLVVDALLKLPPSKRKQAMQAAGIKVSD